MTADQATGMTTDLVGNEDLPAMLLVDDREENLVAVSAALEPLGVPIATATSGEDALRFLLHSDVAVIVLDVQMPGMDGFTLAKHIKDRDRTRSIPIIFLTAISREDHHRLRGFELGAVEYLFKPVDPELLRAKVAVFYELHMKNRLLAKQAEALAAQTAALQQSNDDLEQFSYIASHDLQEPLRIITGFVELLDTRLADVLDEEAADWMRRIRRAAGGMSDLINGLLVYARAGMQPRPPEPVDLDEAFTAALRSVDLGGAQVDAEPLGTAMAAREEIVVVFANLVSNAVKFSGSDAVIKATSSQALDTVTVSVSDNGRGVPEAELERLFGIFERIEDDPYPGTGLGLAVCRRIVQRFSGRIWMENNVDKGVTVRFTLPAATA